MTNKTIYSLTCTIIAMILLGSCQKGIDKEPIVPGSSIETSSYVRFSVTGVQLSGEPWYALVSIESTTGQTLFINKKITLDQIQGAYKTDKIKIDKGDYKLTGFIIVKASDTAFYATPKAGSAKAAQVPNPLAINVQVKYTGVNDVAVQVIKINESDAPASFGYSSSDFGFQPYIVVGVKLKMTVGQVIYDSLPGKLKIDAINNQQEHWIREIDLHKGITAVNIPEEFSEFKFEVDKWNVNIERTFTRSQLHSQMQIEFAGTRNAKRLIQESSFIENAVGLIADSRTEYYYNSSNRLNDIKYFQRSLTVAGLPLTYTYRFVYNGGLLDTIHRLAPTNISTGYAAFFYNGGKISNMYNKSYDQETGAAVEYFGTSNNQMIEADYVFSNGNAMNYTIYTRNGNKISDIAYSSTGGSEAGNYEYDDNINPKHQLGWPDLYFSNYSKNNLTREQKGYTGSIPSAVPYKFEYVYDADGYPSEVFTSYKAPLSQQHLYRIKKVYSYQ